MTLDEFQANKTLKLEAAKWRSSPLGTAMIAVLVSEYLNLGRFGRTAGMNADDKIEHGGANYGFNKSMNVIEQICSEPRPPIKEIQATYASPTPPVQTVVSKPKRETK